MQPVGRWKVVEPTKEDSPTEVKPVGKWSIKEPIEIDTRDTDTFAALEDPNEVYEEVDQEEANFWAGKYNADASIPMEERVAAFNDKQSVEVLPKTSKAIKSAVGSGAFKAEMNSRGLTEDMVVAALENISKVETNGGKNNTISSGMAGGILQVIPSTFKDLLNRDIVGPKALKSLGKTKEELMALPDKKTAEYLRDNDKAAAMFGLAAFINKTDLVEGHEYKNLPDAWYKDPETGERFQVADGERL